MQPAFANMPASAALSTEATHAQRPSLPRSRPVAPSSPGQWVANIPGPLHDCGPGRAYEHAEDTFKEWMEALMFGDQHMLVKELADK